MTLLVGTSPGAEAPAFAGPVAVRGRLIVAAFATLGMGRVVRRAGDQAWPAPLTRQGGAYSGRYTESVSYTHLTLPTTPYV